MKRDPALNPPAAPVIPAEAAAHAAETRALRTAFGRYATGVTVVTCIDTHGVRAGLTCNSFSSLSLEPPLVLWSLRRSSRNFQAFSGASSFVVNVLARGQIDVSRRFSTNTADKFGTDAWVAGGLGAPVLQGAAAVFECRKVSSEPVGDHVLFIGEVLHHTHTSTPPLLFHAGHYHGLGETL